MWKEDEKEMGRLVGGEPSATEDEWVLLYVQQARIGGRGLRKVVDQIEQLSKNFIRNSGCKCAV